MPPATWFVVFFAGHAMLRQAWWLRGLHPGYRHVLACRAVGADATQVVDHRGTRLALEVAPVPIGAFLARLQDASAAWILAVEAPAPADSDRAMPRLLMTCVEVVKAALRIVAPFVLTPRQLARHLRRHHGARPVLPLTA
jgi:hypothetical protein